MRAKNNKTLSLCSNFDNMFTQTKTRLYFFYKKYTTVCKMDIITAVPKYPVIKLE